MHSWGYIASILKFNPVTGEIFWIKPPKYHPRMLGKRAGCIRKTRNGKLYRVIHIDKKTYFCGRLMFFFCNGYWPTPCVDHENGDSLFDAIDNLREATVSQNAWNHKTHKKKAITPMGVRQTRHGNFVARIAFNKQPIHIGTFESAEAAESAYQQKRKELFGEFA